MGKTQNHQGGVAPKERLSTEMVENARPGVNALGKPTDRAYKVWDSGGLFLLVKHTGGKFWRFKYRYRGREKQLSLGTYPLVSLADARLKRDSFRALVADGIDPSTHRKMERAARQAEEAREIAATRFTIDNEGSLSFRLGNRCLTLTPVETLELRSFLDATRAVIPKETPCP